MDAFPNNPSLSAYTNNLRAGLRLATGVPVARDDFRVSFEQGLWLLLTLFALELLFAFAGTERPASYSSYGLNALGAAYLFELMLMLVIARWAGADLYQTGGLLIAYLAAMPIYLAFAHLLIHFSETGHPGLLFIWTTGLLPLAWQLYILVRLLRLFVRLRIGRCLLLALFYTGLSVGSLWLLPRADLWYSIAADETPGPYARLYEMSVEDLFYNQHTLLETSLQKVSDQRPGETDLYLLAVGGYGLEKVFLNEVEYVKALFDERFDTRDHSLLLVNNVETVERYPLANRHNLRAALAHIGQRMDPDEDLLFLFMTSHGSRSHHFSVSFGPVPLDDLTPQQVRQALDDAGIRWRVIVVSSCYSGGFIEPLKDPRTLIITAAAPDRQSFGCGASSEFTDFGTAYFKHALDRERDFVDAFDLAADWVAEKERRENRKASLPQRFVGEVIREKLAMLDAAGNRDETPTAARDDLCRNPETQATCRP
jgi:hypothetical protein